MCGIYGQALFVGEPDSALCRHRLSLLAHRGPDHEGHYAANGVFLGHRRLSIIDPNPSAHQPFGDEGRMLAYNGEVYNFLSLRDSAGAGEWRTRSDTEVLYRMLRNHGETRLDELNGMFAFAYWDGVKNSLLLARDRAGIKPLYYRLDSRGLEFASEIKAFEVKAENLAAMKEVFARGFLGEGTLPFPEVRELEPGHWLRLDLATRRWESRPFASLQKFVSPERMRALAEPSLAATEVERRLTASVTLHLQSDAPVGSLCSGGVDSTLLSALALKSRRDLRLYHCGVEGRGGEEHYARQAARHLGAELVVERLRAEDFLALWPRVTWHLDMPVYHPSDMSLYHIANRAHQDGVKVLLCGEGADELFGGYSWHRNLLRLLRGRERLEQKGKWAARLWPRLRRLLDFAWGRADFTRVEAERFAAFGLADPPPGIDRIYKGYSLFAEDFGAWKRWDRALEAYAGRAPGPEAAVLSLMLENLQGHLRSILHRTDRILMACSIEGRVPFLENGLFELGLNLPLAQKIQGRETKVALKSFARKHLPASLVERPKLGFPLPWESYLPRRPRLLENGFVSEWSGLTAGQLHAFHGDDAVLLFRLLSLEVWGRLFHGGEKPDAIQVH